MKPKPALSEHDQLHADALKLRDELEQESVAFAGAVAEARRRNARVDHLRQEMIKLSTRLEREGRSDLAIEPSAVKIEPIDPAIVERLSPKAKELDSLMAALTTDRRHRIRMERRRTMFQGVTPDSGRARPRYAMGRPA